MRVMAKGESIELRLRHAGDHLMTLEEAVKKFRAHSPPPVTFHWRENTVDQTTRTYHATARVNEEPPSGLALIVGDVLHNMRSALDHAVWRAADEEKRGKWTAFPIALKSREWKKSRALEGVPSDLVRRARALQPFVEMPGDPKRHPLAILAKLSNIDKHRTLHTFALSRTGEVVRTGEDVEVLMWTLRQRPLATGKEAMGFTARLKRPGGAWVVNPEADYEVGIETASGPAPMLSTLRQCLSRVREVIDRFEH
jgi:hypothetical protein